MLKHIIGLVRAILLIATSISPGAAQTTVGTLTPPIATINGLTPDANGNVVMPTTSFVAGFVPSAPGLKGNLPACGGSSATVGSYAVVSDLYSNFANTNEVMRCTQTGTITYWRPQRTDASVSMATPTNAMTLLPLATPPVIHFTTTASASSSVTPSTVGAWPGEQFTIVQDGALGLFSLQIGGLLGGVLNMVTGGARTLTYSCTPAATPVCGWVGN